jgi:hypothetical protein
MSEEATTPWEDGKFARIANCPDIDPARAVAERLAEERR